MSLAMFAYIGLKSWEGREATLAQSAKDARNLSHSLAQHAARTIEAADLVLTGVQERLRNGTWTVDKADRMHKFLMQRVEQLPQVREFVVLDASGYWRFASVPELPSYSNADRDYFIFHRTHLDPALRISEPVKSRLAGKWSIMVTRRLEDGDGNFAGVILASLDVEYLQRFYESLDIGPNGGIAIYREDGKLLLRRPYREENVGRDVSGNAYFREHIARAPSGYYRAKSPFDGAVKRTAYEHLPDFPVIVSVAR
jgi:hypothetical protein